MTKAYLNISNNINILEYTLCNLILLVVYFKLNKGNGCHQE